VGGDKAHPRGTRCWGFEEQMFGDIVEKTWLPKKKTLVGDPSGIGGKGTHKNQRTKSKGARSLRLKRSYERTFY